MARSGRAVLALALGLLAAAAARAEAPKPVDFAHDVVPLLKAFYVTQDGKGRPAAALFAKASG